MIVVEGSIAAAKRENAKLRTLLKMSVRHHLSRRWFPMNAVNDDPPFDAVPA